jgi:cysteine synthase B
MAQAFPIRLPGLRASHLLETVGNTPLLRLEKMTGDLPGIEIYGKAEYFNPGGSIKDRAALNMILEGERTGRLNSSRTILDATSGNTGLAYSMIAAARGYRVKLCLPANASPERKRMLKAYGAEVVLTPAGEGSDGAILTSTRISTAIRRTGRLITTGLRSRFWIKPGAGSRISSPPWGPAGRLWASLGGFAGKRLR